MISVEDIEAARRRLAGVILPTPLRPSAALTRLAGRPVLLKPEHLQRTGSFKLRGAYNHISRLPDGVQVVAASAGNHAQGVALAASMTGRGSTIFMPAGASIPKVEATVAYGAEVRLGGSSVDECIGFARRHATEHDALYVPPFDDPEVIAGQGTLGLELADEAPDAEVVVVPTGGGGLLAGTAVALHARRPRVRVIGVEASGAQTVGAALAAGRPVTLPSMATMADGIAVGATSELVLEHVQAYVDGLVCVEEAEISRAMLALVERAKAVVEPSGAAAMAAVLAGRLPGEGPVVVVLSGGNVDPLLLTRIIENGLAVAGRYLSMRVVVADRPGALATLIGALASLGVNVLSVEHHRFGPTLDPDQVEVLVTVETRNRAQHDEVIATLAACGFTVEVLS
ncbi:MAG: threonine ammonia-lyase [Actinomycetota bacterium]|nr:threonine ammonia-lyase [Actinomycetota bacterium]